MMSLVTCAPVPHTLGRGMSAMPRPSQPRRALQRPPRVSAYSTEVFQVAEQVAEKVAAKVGDVSAPGAQRISCKDCT